MGILIALLYVFCMYLWLPAWLAKKFGAERGQIRWVLMSIIIFFALYTVLFFTVYALVFDNNEHAMAAGILMHATALNGVLLQLGIFVATVFVFSKCVQLGYWRSFGIQLVPILPLLLLGVFTGAFSSSNQQTIKMSKEHLAIVSQGNITRELLADTVTNICELEYYSDAQKQEGEFYTAIVVKFVSENPDNDSIRDVKRLNTRMEKCFVDAEPKRIAKEKRDKRRAERGSGSISVAKNAEPREIDIVENSGVESDVAELKADVIQEDPAYQVVKLSEAGKYIGGSVIVKRKSADDMKGKLVAVENGTLKVQQRRYGGNVTFPIATKDIASLEVYY